MAGVYILFLLIEFTFALLVFAYTISALYSSFKGSAYVPTKQKETDLILKEAKLKKGSVFIDLGCGDGRVVRTAVKNYQVQGIGIDINPLLIIYAKLRAKSEKLKTIEFRTQNIFDVEMRKADAIYIFLMPKLIEKFLPKLKKEAKRNTLLISHAFKVPTLKPFKTINHEPFPTYYYKL